MSHRYSSLVTSAFRDLAWERDGPPAFEAGDRALFVAARDSILIPRCRRTIPDTPCRIEGTCATPMRNRYNQDRPTKVPQVGGYAPADVSLTLRKMPEQ